jgi:hypothetical protein
MKRKKIQENWNRGRGKVQEEKVETWKKREDRNYRTEHEGNIGHQRVL